MNVENLEAYKAAGNVISQHARNFAKHALLVNRSMKQTFTKLDDGFTSNIYGDVQNNVLLCGIGTKSLFVMHDSYAKIRFGYYEYLNNVFLPWLKSVGIVLYRNHHFMTTHPAFSNKRRKHMKLKNLCEIFLAAKYPETWTRIYELWSAVNSTIPLVPKFKEIELQALAMLREEGYVKTPRNSQHLYRLVCIKTMKTFENIEVYKEFIKSHYGLYILSKNDEAFVAEEPYDSKAFDEFQGSCFSALQNLQLSIHPDFAKKWMYRVLGNAQMQCNSWALGVKETVDIIDNSDENSHYEHDVIDEPIMRVDPTPRTFDTYRAPKSIIDKDIETARYLHHLKKINELANNVLTLYSQIFER